MVNVIVPMYHAKDTIKDVLNSLLAQTKKMFIVTLVQDADGEDYSDIIQTYAELGLKIRLIQHLENCGPGVARQTGIDSTDMCDYVMFVDADDMLCPRAIEILYAEAKRNNLDVLTSSVIREEIGGPGQVLLSTNTPVTWVHGKIYRWQYLKDFNITFPSDFRLNEDSYFNLVAVNSTKAFARIEEVTYIWRFNKQSLTRSVEDKDFFKKSWILYVRSQVQGLLDIIKNTGDVAIPLMAQTLMNAYSHMELAKFYKVLDYDRGKLELRGLNNEIIIEKIKNEDFWKYVYTNLRCGVPVKTGLVFFKTRFVDWLKKVHLLEENVNDIRS